MVGPQHSGLTLTSYPGENAAVSGGKVLKTTWTAFNTTHANIYVADIKGQVKEVPGLQLDGKRATRARYPNLPWGIEVRVEPCKAVLMNDLGKLWLRLYGQ